MPKEPPKQSIPRQRPVSCRFCRTRKLRCSRDVPCSNCVARGLKCDLEDAVRPSASSPLASDPEVLRRLERLETLLLSQRAELEKNSRLSLELPGSESPVSHSRIACLTPLSPEIQNIDNDVAWLESIYTGHNLSHSQIPLTQIVFKICQVRHIATAQPYVISDEGVPSRCIWLPQYEEAKVLLNKYRQVAYHLAFVTDIRSLPSMLDEVYSDIAQQRQVQPGYAILLLAIFAGAAHSWIRPETSQGVLSTLADALQLSAIWIKATEDVMDVAYRSANVSIEAVQGLVMLFYLVAHMEGVTPRCRSLFSAAIQVSRDLGLHRIDHPSNADNANSIGAEMGRRVWWYVCATDWTIAARFTGVSEGVYTCHPRHMITRKPLHIDDSDLIDGSMGHLERPLSVPTSMSYSLLRIRLAEISRNSIDRNPLSAAMHSAPSVNDIWDIDTELQMLLNDFQPYLTMSKEQLISTYGMTDARANDFVHHGNMLHFMVYAQRCKLHLPYFARGFVEASFASSREVCVRTARLIIQVEPRYQRSAALLRIRCKFGGLIVGVFMASIVLLMDLCVNRSAPGHEQRRSEVAEAFRILEDAKNESEMTARFVDSLMHILRKHKMVSPQSTCQSTNNSNITTLTSKPPLLSSTTTEYIQPTLSEGYRVASEILQAPPTNAIAALDGSGNGANTHVPAYNTIPNPEDLPYFSEFTAGFAFGVDPGSFDWNNILSDLGTSFI
ncbi:hypothetical protein BDV96DRAFT_605125 [Lophiotrema nucula]|uniref:Zn(2)-C6 fungal-type domain-containing protein n=1 Tax=Lophiotrema nucula TaxID=690887 RepID=A0A6A5YRI8_9PLEO|nr:hypothetical protein BDV96DRAFT_605125 [Lophiotrema nucula]